MILKRSLFCGILWCLVSLQYLSDPEAPAVLFVITFLLGLATAGLSLRYETRKNTVLKVLLGVQTVYYLVGFAYCVMVETQPSMQAFGCLISTGMIVILVSTLVTLTQHKYGHPAYQ